MVKDIFLLKFFLIIFLEAIFVKVEGQKISALDPNLSRVEWTIIARAMVGSFIIIVKVSNITC